MGYQEQGPQPQGFRGILGHFSKINPRHTTGSKCQIYIQEDFCPKSNTCRLFKKDYETPIAYKGTIQNNIYPEGICVKDVALTAAESKQVLDWFHTLDKHNTSKLSQYDAGVLDPNHYHFDVHLENSILKSVHITASDKNKDGYIDLNEWVAGCAKLKNRDPQDFPTFLQFVNLLKPLKPGSRCSDSDIDVAKCPFGTVCRRATSNIALKCLPIAPKYQDCSSFASCSPTKPCTKWGICSPVSYQDHCKPDEYTCSRFPIRTTKTQLRFTTPSQVVVVVKGRRK